MKSQPVRELFPSLAEVENYAKAGEYRVVPVRSEILSDFLTPIEAMRILRGISAHTYLLESVAEHEKWGRYTFLGFNPKLSITCKDGVLRIDRKEIPTANPSAYLRELLAEYYSPKIAGMPPFTGGLVGYFAYDFINYCEPAAKVKVEDNEGFQDLDLMLFDTVIAFDNFAQKIFLIQNISLNNYEAEYAAAGKKLADLAKLLHTGKKQQIPAGRLLSEPKPLYSREEFCNMVEHARKHIFAGDIFQIVLSNCLSAPFSGSLFNTYRVLRTLNPSPYMFYFSGTDVEVAGASPETLVKLHDGVLHTFPLAGTRPRGVNEAEDIALAEELLADEKELAEHNMLVDLGRNDLGKISRFGTVQVVKLREIQRYSHVMHIGSTVRGQIRKDRDALDAIAAVLPAGTLSGAPKIRACQIIGELENNKRGIYGGAIGYIDFSGNMDTCIAIRTAYKKNGQVFVRSGAGIVADSVADKEFAECVNKAKAIVRALEISSGLEQADAAGAAVTSAGEGNSDDSLNR
ncbi:anthranilate synthase component I [Arcanobacterium hippocoleae]